jgi:HSP20 family protein
MLRRKRAALDEFDEVERRVDEFFERVFSVEPMWDMRARSLKPLYDIKETRESIIVLVDLPYVEKGAVQLRVDEDSIDLSAELREPIKYGRWGTAQRECEFTKLSATIPLPTKVDPEGTTAKLTHGVLTVELPKIIKKRTIEVK